MTLIDNRKQGVPITADYARERLDVLKAECERDGIDFYGRYRDGLNEYLRDSKARPLPPGALFFVEVQALDEALAREHDHFPGEPLFLDLGELAIGAPGTPGTT